MDDKAQTTTRAERLARQLRENLHRRKAQARAMQGASAEGTEAGDTALSKTPTDR